MNDQMISQTQQPPQSTNPVQPTSTPPSGLPPQQGKGLNWVAVIMIIAILLLFAGIVYYLIVQSTTSSSTSVSPTSSPAQNVMTPAPSSATEEEQIDAVDVSEPTEELQDVQKDLQGL